MSTSRQLVFVNTWCRAISRWATTPVVLGALLGGCGHAVESPTAQLPPRGPIGYDSFRRLDLLPMLRVGVRAGQFSSFDRRGSNNDGIRGTYSCLRRTESHACIIAEHVGPGEIDSMWFTRSRGVVRRTGEIVVKLDGRVVLKAPLHRVVAGALGPPFSFPLVANSTQSSGGVYIKVPMPFRTRMQVTTSTPPLYYHVAWRAFATAGGIRTFDPGDPASDVLVKLRGAGLGDPKAWAPNASTTGRSFSLAPGNSITLTRRAGPGLITGLRLRLRRISPPHANLSLAWAGVLRSARIRMSFDGRRTVDSPLGEFFGSAIGPTHVRSLMVAQSPSTGWLSAWWPMPFAHEASIVLTNGSSREILGADVTTTGAPSEPWGKAVADGQAGLFHATSHQGSAPPGRDWPLLLISGRHGIVVGVVQTMRGPRNRRYLEGDERVSTDGSPAGLYHGTGTEDFYEGGFYFNRGAFSLPLSGAPALRAGGPGCLASACTAAYRLLIGDAIPFVSSLRFTIEHGDRNRVPGVYSSTVFWYG